MKDALTQLTSNFRSLGVYFGPLEDFFLCESNMGLCMSILGLKESIFSLWELILGFGNIF